jgi:hypothetical protein
MRVTLSIDLTDERTDDLRHDVQTFLHLMTRGQWQVTEADGLDAFTLVMVDFRDPTDAENFTRWRNIGRHICRSQCA